MTINFSKKLYNLRAVQNSVKAYEGLGLFFIENEKSDIKVKITDIDKDMKDILKDEFCNYVLSEVKK